MDTKEPKPKTFKDVIKKAEKHIKDCEKRAFDSTAHKNIDGMNELLDEIKSWCRIYKL